MKEFTIKGLDTLEKKAEAEAILKAMGCSSCEWWNNNKRSDVNYNRIDIEENGVYNYFPYASVPYDEIITLDELRAMRPEPTSTEPPHDQAVWDMFAAAALQGLLGNLAIANEKLAIMQREYWIKNYGDITENEAIAKDVVGVVDAMMVERTKRMKK